jgi:hypothetical protein
MLRDLLVDAPWKPLRSEPRYQSLLEGLNYPARPSSPA